MKEEITAENMSSKCFPGLLALVIFAMFLGGCSYHDKQYSYFNMLDEKKRTLSNRQAAEKFWSSVRPVSTLSDSHYKLGRHYQQKGSYDKAIEQFAKALRNDSTYCKAYNGIAMSYDALRRCEAAKDSYEQGLKCSPEQAYLYNNYAYSCLLCGEYVKGVTLLRKAEQLAESNIRIRNNLKLAQDIASYMASQASDLAATQLPPAVEELALSLPDEKQETVLSDVHNSFSDGASLTITPDLDKTYSAPETEMSKTTISPQVTIAISPIATRSTQTKTISVAVLPAPITEKEGGKVLVASSVSSPQETTGSLDLVENKTQPQHQDKLKLIAKQTKTLLLPSPQILALDLKNSAIEVSNGNGRTGMASRSADFFRGFGFNIKRITNAPNFRFEESVIFYKDEYLQIAKELSAIIPGAQTLKRVETLERATIGIKIVLGKDLVDMRFPEIYEGIAKTSQGTRDVYLSSTMNVSP